MNFKENHLSLQFRLMLGIALICTLGMSILTFWLGWEMRQILTLDETNFRTKILIITVQSIIITVSLAIVFIRQTLAPLQRVVQWTNNHRLTQEPLRVKGMPSEMQTLVKRWNRLLLKLSETRQQQRQFANDLAHELRTPLSMIYGYLQRTQQQSQNLTESQKESLAMAVADAERMNQLLQDWLELIRSDRGVVEMKSLLLNELAREVVEMKAKFKHREIQLDLPSNAINVRTDQNKLMQLLNHLLDNAIKYSPMEKPIIVRLTQSRDSALIEVSDRGCGIPLDEQERIFDPFYRVDPSRTRATGGAGLGLSLVKQLIEDLGGDITMRSQPGQGSTFILTLSKEQNNDSTYSDSRR